MNDSELRGLLIDRLRQVAPEGDYLRLRGSDLIRETLDIDSFDFLTFLIGLSTVLGVDIPEADYGRLNTLDDMVRYLASRTSGTGGC